MGGAAHRLASDLVVGDATRLAAPLFPVAPGVLSGSSSCDDAHEQATHKSRRGVPDQPAENFTIA